MNTEKIMEDIQSVQDNIREIKSTWGNTIMTLDNIKSGLKADVQKKADESYQRGYDDGYEAGCATAFKPVSDAEYQRGFEDGKESTEKGCGGCKYEWYGDTEDPCWHCRRCYKDKYEPTLHSDRIEVGDEVISDTGTKFIVTAFTTSDSVCGFSERGLGCFNTIDKLTKTGKHYDIASILEAMRK